jgi:hypothetical protein
VSGLQNIYCLSRYSCGHAGAFFSKRTTFTTFTTTITAELVVSNLKETLDLLQCV